MPRPCQMVYSIARDGYQGKACGKHGEIIIFGALRETLGSGGWVRKGEQRLVAVPVVSAGRREKMT